MRALIVVATLMLQCIGNAEYCGRLRKQYQEGNSTGKPVMALGVKRQLGLYWSSPPAHAEAALLHAVLAHGLRYREVHLKRGPHRVQELANLAVFDDFELYKELIIGVSVAWTGEPGYGLCKEYWECGVAGPRLREFGAGVAPVRLRVHLYRAPGDNACKDATTQWTSLIDCKFFDLGVLMYHMDDEYLTIPDIAESLIQRIKALSTQFKLKSVNRRTLVEQLQESSRSFLFLDYDIWNNVSNVHTMELPPCSNLSACLDDWSQALRVSESRRITTDSFEIFYKFHKFHPSVESLRKILNDAAVEKINVDEAACKWSLENKETFAKWATPLPITGYFVLVFLCDKDPDLNEYQRLLDKINTEIIKKYIKENKNLIIRLEIRTIDCLVNPCKMPTAINDILDGYSRRFLLGVVAGGVEILALTSDWRLPWLLYDVPAHDFSQRNNTVWASSGTPLQLAHVFRHFAFMQSWTRFAVISERETSLAGHVFDALKSDNLTLRNFPVSLNISRDDAGLVVENLLNTDARIVFLNTGADVAATVLSAAMERNMTREDKFAWIVREWQPSKYFSSINITQISYWCMGDDKLTATEGRPELRNKMNQLWPGRAWPPRAVSLSDAILSITSSFKEAIKRSPDILYDMQTDDAIREYISVLNSNGALGDGVVQELRYSEKTRTRAQPYVFVDRWRGIHRESVGLCRVSDNADVTCELREQYTVGAPSDGASTCVTRSGDPFSPNCYDAAWIALLVALLTGPPAAWLVRRTVRQRLARRDRVLLLSLLARRERAAEALSGHLVPRSALEIREELGAGRFGRVSLALLRTQGHAPRVVAAKALRKGAAAAEESEFLREACTLAALDHEHVVRLVGVCADDGPPLVLMEHAFFGDLLQYLRERRHLAETDGAEGAEEAAQVGPRALTRLAREAAAALGYLALRGLVHRDVRAANCLVDVRRSLKLADFGMARETAAGADGSAEYACRRRALFPVLWMAPESLAHGVFSTASDVWALGVLLLELVTLGERPFGDTSPLRVLQYVASGGRPPLPLDATPQTRGVALACWRREPEQRPSAADVVSYLADRPTALRPALCLARPEFWDTDSGYGEPSSPDLLVAEIILDVKT